MTFKVGLGAVWRFVLEFLSINFTRILTRIFIILSPINAIKMEEVIDF